jgi:hypothetical protein
MIIQKLMAVNTNNIPPLCTYIKQASHPLWVDILSFKNNLVVTVFAIGG